MTQQLFRDIGSAGDESSEERRKMETNKAAAREEIEQSLAIAQLIRNMGVCERVHEFESQCREKKKKTKRGGN